MSDIITALKRLERAGSEDSRETQKLLDAAGTLALYIAKLVPDETPLPLGYYVKHCTIGFLHNDTGAFISVSANRAEASEFAYQIAHGWLDELSDWLEARTAGSAEAGATLRRAAEAMK